MIRPSLTKPRSWDDAGDPVRDRMIRQQEEDRAASEVMVSSTKEDAGATASEVRAASAVVPGVEPDLHDLLMDLHRAADALATAYAKTNPSSDPTVCVVQGRVESALETVEAAVDIIKGLI